MYEIPSFVDLCLKSDNYRYSHFLSRMKNNFMALSYLGTNSLPIQTLSDSYRL